MTASDGKTRLLQLARTEDQLALLKGQEAAIHAERAKLFDGLATGETLVMAPGPKRRARHLPKFDRPISDEARERARQLLEAHETKMRNSTR
jgi:hypothetical protein